MNQIALPLPALVAEPSAFDAAGFEIGWDHARFGLTPPAEHLLPGHPVRQGWEAGRVTFGARTRAPTRHVQRWLELRLAAWQSGWPLEDPRVTPHFLAQLEVPHCPVTREPLTTTIAPAARPSDAVVTMLRREAGCVAGNLVMVSRRVAAARAACSAAEATAIALRIEAGESAPPAGLDAGQWLRLAALLSMAVPAPPARGAWLPLAVLPPNRVHVLNAVQAFQVLLTQQFTAAAYGRRTADLAALMPDAGARRQFAILMSALLARRLAVGCAAERATLRQVLADAWMHPLVRRRWQQLALRITCSDCERVVRLAMQRGLAGAGVRWVDDAPAGQGWAAARPDGPARGDRAAGGERVHTCLQAARLGTAGPGALPALWPVRTTATAGRGIAG